MTLVRSDRLVLEKDRELLDPYITAGDRAYLIGSQDGSFPDLGSHVPGEMGGLWAHPVKLLDGFWLRVDETWLTGATLFRSAAFWNEHEYALEGLQITRRQFVPDGEPSLVVRYAFCSEVARVLPLRFLARSDLQGVWLSDRDGIRDGWDHARFDSGLDAWVVHDDLNPWFVLVGARGAASIGHESGRALWGPERTRGQGISVALDYELQLGAGEEAVVEFVLAGGHTGMAAAQNAFARTRGQVDGFWVAKASRYEAMLAQSRLEVPDQTIVAAWDWVKCNYDWLVRDLPGRGRGLGAGLPEYPWFFGCDSTYALFGSLALGQYEVALQTLDLLRELSLAWNGPSGRVIHEANTRGHVYNPGNTQETPHFTKAVWHTFLWTGDIEFLRRNYLFCKQGLLEWVMGERCAEGDPLPFGFGIMEVEGLNLQMVDTAAYTVEALEALAGMAEVVGERHVVNYSRRLSQAARERLEAAFWLEEEGLYGEILATPAQMIPRLRGLIGRAERSEYIDMTRPGVQEAYGRLIAQAENDPEQDERRPWLLKNWITITPLEAGITPADRALRVLDRVERSEFTGHWGMYLNGIEQAQVMSINTGVLAVAELNYGRVEHALAYVRKIAEPLTLHMPGAIAEVAPDGGCFVQAWSGYGIAWPVVAQVFGVRPNAHERRLLLEPRFPTAWTQVSLKGLRVGTNNLDLTWDGRVLQVLSREPGWTIEAKGVEMITARA